jgi:hypothetical protein
MFPPCLWRRRDPRRFHHALQGGGRHAHHLRPHVCHQQCTGVGLVYRSDLESRKTDLGERRWNRGKSPQPPLLPDRPLCGHFMAVHVVDDVGVHQAVPVVVAVLRICAVQKSYTGTLHFLGLHPICPQIVHGKNTGGERMYIPYWSINFNMTTYYVTSSLRIE